MEQGQIIYLNGTSSSGKTTIARELQDVLDEPYMYVSVDDFFEMLPKRFGNEPPRDLQHKVITGMHRCVAALSLAGNKVIVDDVLDRKTFWAECIETLADLPVLFVGVQCPLEELERRERERGDRDEGMARNQLSRVHQYGIYDVDVDTSTCSPAECAAQIASALGTSAEGVQLPNAFQRIRDVMAAETGHR